MIKLFFTTLLKIIPPSLYRRLRIFIFSKLILPKEFITYVNRLPPSSLVIDIGANIGRVSEILAKLRLHVISFEPNSYAFEKLKINLQSFPNIELRKEAVGIKNQQRKLYFHKNFKNTDADLTQASSLLNDKLNVSSENFELVKEIDFAEFLVSLNKPVELVKMDIEGYEVQLLNYLLDKKVIDKVNVFFIETHEQKFIDFAEPLKKLKNRIKREGYKDKFFFNWS